MPPERTTEKWPLWDNPYKPGYIEGEPSRNPDRPPRAVVRWCGCKHATGVPFLDAYRAEAIRAGRAWVRAIERKEIPDPRRARTGAAAGGPSAGRTAGTRSSTKPGGPFTIVALFAEFFANRLIMPQEDRGDPRKIELFEERRQAYKASLLSVFPHDFAVTDQTITDRISAWLKNPTGRPRIANGAVVAPARPLARLSQRNTLTRVRQFTDFCIGMRYIAVDPFKVLPIPTFSAGSAKSHYTPEQRRILMAWICREIRMPTRRTIARTKMTLPHLPNLLRLEGLAGVRPGECISLVWESAVSDWERDNYVTDDAIVLMTTKTGERRTIPYRLFPKLAAVIDHQRRHTLRGGKLFPFKNTGEVARLLKIALDAAGVPIENKRFNHVIRGIASAEMESWGLSEKTVSAIIGNSKRVRDIYYNNNKMSAREWAKRNARAIAERVLQERGETAPPPRVEPPRAGPSADNARAMSLGNLSVIKSGTR